jgi:hypothetical protein
MRVDPVRFRQRLRGLIEEYARAKSEYESAGHYNQSLLDAMSSAQEAVNKELKIMEELLSQLTVAVPE